MISIIGGNGFIGKNIQEKLSESNTDYMILDQKESSATKNIFFKQCDVTNVDDLNHSIEEDSILINLAAEHKDNVFPVSKYYEVNVEGAKNICQIAEVKNIKKIIFTSSVAVYGFAEDHTDENGKVNPFNHYGKSKIEAEKVYEDWQKKDPQNRSLVIIRPTAVFGEENRGNVYNLLKQINSKNFIMIGNGKNKKSIAYVRNVADFIIFSTKLNSGIHIYNYIDKPDLTMNELVSLAQKELSIKPFLKFKLPYFVAIIIGMFFDIFSKILSKEMIVSSIRIKKFCSNSLFDSSVGSSGFSPKYDLKEALRKTIKHEFKKKKELV